MGTVQSLVPLPTSTENVVEFSLPREIFEDVQKTDPCNRAASIYLNSPVNINQLPDEVLLKIFEFFSVPDVLTYVLPVCRRWRGLSNDITLWKSLKFGNGWSATKLFEANMIKRLIKKSPLLKTFEYYSGKYINNIITTLSQCSHKLEVLELQCQSLNFRTIEKLAIGCPHIHQLSFHMVEGEDPTNYLPLASLKHLKVLEFFSCKWADDTLLNAMSKNCTSLRYLNLQDLQNLTDKAIENLVSQSKKTLKTVMLHLKASMITDNVFLEISQCTELEKLTLVPAFNLTDDSFVSLVALKKLVSININKLIRVSSNTLKYVFENGNWTKMKDFDFISTDCLTDDSLKYLAMSAPNLEVLSLSSCQRITELGISRVLTYCKNLAYLNLERLPNLFGTFLSDVKKKLPRLMVLRVVNCVNIDQNFLTTFIQNKSQSLNVFTEKSLIYSQMETSLQEYPATHRARFQVRFCDLNMKNDWPVKLSSVVYRRNLS